MISLKMMGPSIPFPTKSSIHNQKNWRISTNSVIKKVAMKGPMNDLIMSISSFLITSVCLVDVCFGNFKNADKNKAFTRGINAGKKCRGSFNKEPDHAKGM